MALASPPAAAEPAVPARTLLFAAGPGRDAILARERGDRATAGAKLDEVLGLAALSPLERAGALWLRGLEHLADRDHRRAAERFAEARTIGGLPALDGRLIVLEAQAWLDAGEPARARALTVGVAFEPPIAGDAALVAADALVRTGGVAEAIAVYRRYLDAGSGARGAEARAKLARALVETGRLAEAVEAYRHLWLHHPLSDYGREAERALPGLEARARIRIAARQRRELELEHALAVVDDHLDRRQYAGAVTAADALLRRPRLPDVARCRAGFAKGTAIFKQRARARARPAFALAARACEKAGASGAELRVKAGYQAARGRYAEGRHREAAHEFAALARKFPEHAYADDALLLEGESWVAAGDRARARAAYARVLADTPSGDMVEEARRRLVLLDLQDRAYAEVLAGLDGAVRRSGPEGARLEYFRGRALAALDRGDEARSAFAAAFAAAPLEYPGLVALSRLAELGGGGVEPTLRGFFATESAPGTAGATAATPAWERARLLALLGLAEEARAELGAAGVSGWEAIELLHGAGHYPEVQRMLADLDGTWRRQAPAGAGRRRWELAYPMPFSELVVPLERRFEVPSLLAYAVMQTESRFDPSVTSSAGARGLIQLMPSTAERAAVELGTTLASPDRLWDPGTNLELGIHHLGRLIARWGGGPGGVALAVPSYNAGEGAVERWLTQRSGDDLDLFIEAIPYDETRAYTQRVLGRWLAYRVVHGGGAELPLLPGRLPRNGSAP